MVRSIVAPVACLALASSLRAQAPAAPRLAFDSTGTDTATCDDFLLRFLDFRADPIGGNGFLLRVSNRTGAARDFDPTALQAELRTGRRVRFLAGREVATQYLQGERLLGMDSEERARQQRDIEYDLRFSAGRVPAYGTMERFLALGWTREVRGDPARLLPVTVHCAQDRLGRIGLAPAHDQHH